MSNAMQLTHKSHYNPCFWTAHWNPRFLEAALKGEANYQAAREHTVYALNVKSNRIRQTSVGDVHYDKGVGVAEITPDAAKEFCRRRQPAMYDDYCEYVKHHPETLCLDVEALLTGIEGTEAYRALKKVVVKGRIDGPLEKGFLAGFIAVHHARSHAVLQSTMELKQAGLHWFESVWMLQRYLSNTDVLYRHVMTYAMGYFTLYKLCKDTFPLNDSPILIRPESIMVALSPRLLLEIDRTRNNIPHDCAVSNYIPREKLEEFRRRTIANTFREIIFGSPALLEEWRSTKEFAERHALMRNVKCYNTVVEQYAGGEIWRLNAYSDREPAHSTPVVMGPGMVLLYPRVPQEARAANVVRIPLADQGGHAGAVVPLFTGAEFAEKFLSAVGEGASGMTILELASLDELESLLADLRRGGITHVHFNAMPRGLAAAEPVLIGEVIDRLRVSKAKGRSRGKG